MKIKTFIAGVALLGIISTATAQNSMFLNTPEHSNFFDSNFPDKVILKKKWSVKTEGKVFGTAAYSEGMIYFGSDDSCLYAVTTEGELKWKFRTTERIRSTPAIKDDIIMVHNYGGRFYALNKATGAELWHFNTEGDVIYSAPGINGSFPSDQVNEDSWDIYQSSPVFSDSIVYFGSGKNMYALKIKDGSLFWVFNAPNVIHSSPALSKGKIFVGCWDSKVYALNAMNGQKIWDFQTGLDPEYSLMTGIQSSPSVIDTLVVFGSRDAHIYAVHTESGSQIWKAGFGGSWMPSSFVVVKDTLYTGSSDAAGLYALNLKDGKSQYSIRFPSFCFSTPAYANGTIFMGCVNGSLFCIDTKSRKIKGRFDTDGHKKNILNALKPDGSLNEEVFPYSREYSDAVLWQEILYTTGSIFASPIIVNNVVFVGSTDSAFYAVVDEGGCKPDFKLESGALYFENPIGTINIDTTITLTNLGSCDEDFLLNTNKSNSKFLNGITFDATEYSVAAGESHKIRIKGSIDFGKATTLKTQFSLLSKRNEYIQQAVNVEIKIATSLKKMKESVRFSLFPNPTSDFTNIQYSLEKAGSVEIDIYNHLSQHVEKLQSAKQPAGNYELRWNSNAVAPGLYFCAIMVNNEKHVKGFIKK